MGYEETHPWITFEFDLAWLSRRSWLLLGEAASKCEHVAGVPLKPAVANMFNTVYLTKGAHGTTAIEGNTLSEEEVRKVIEGELELPPSQEYRQKEVENFVRCANEITQAVAHGEPLELSPERLSRLNAQLLESLPVREGVVPGEIRDYSVGVRLYRGAPHQEVEDLLIRMCKWLEGPDFEIDGDRDLMFVRALIRAVLAHLYIAWIHPFGDGNGRLARLVEFQIMLEGGVPLPAAHLLSDFYNFTRDKYYLELERTERDPYPVSTFIEYALEGLVDEIREQISTLREAQLMVTWQNYVHEAFQDENTPAKVRQRHLVLDLPIDEWTQRKDIRGLTPRMAAAYANKGSKTITRDLNVLETRGLIKRHPTKGIQPNIDLMRAFLPLRAQPA